MMEQQRGVALITALLVVSIATIVATSMLSRKNLEIRRQSNITHWSQAYQYALGIEAWGRQILVKDLKPSNNKDSLTEDWATLLPPMEVSGGRVSGSIEDLQGRFNLNNLQLSGSTTELKGNLVFGQFQRLLEHAEGDPDTAYAVVDWIDNDEAQSPRGVGGAEDDHYLGEDLPYRAANQPFVSASELLLVRGMSRDVYDKLRPAIIALPGQSKINVNTAVSEVLRVLDPVLNEDDVEGLRDKQMDGGVDSLAQFMKLPEFSGSSFSSDKDKNKFKSNITVKSDYFLIHANVIIGETSLNLSSLIRRSGDKAELLRRTFGAL